MRILSSYNVSAKPVFVRPIKLHLAAIGFLFGATIAQSLDAAPASEKSGKQFCVCIDPGHPSENNDGGAVANQFRTGFAAALEHKLRDNGVKGDEDTFIGRRQGALTGSIFSEAPTILVEMVFLTNPMDAEWIKQDRNKQTMARALAAGVRAVRDSR